ncbi:homeobox protein goosecoid-2 [Fukomys damarensis]|uniref:homeobox protein goosecoid-2 n=1 Tax=Fukomys damarensis TaxID=885580 RepID=UPI00053FE693|nr:homeobox protein goosecoid-2 [Fukomys damarensis]
MQDPGGFLGAEFIPFLRCGPSGPGVESGVCPGPGRVPPSALGSVSWSGLPVPQQRLGLSGSLEGSVDSPWGVVPGAPEKRPRQERTVYTRGQQERLEELFAKEKYPSQEQKAALAESLKVAVEKVQVWFKNRRAKFRREQMEGKSPSGSGGHKLCSELSPPSPASTRPTHTSGTTARAASGRRPQPQPGPQAPSPLISCQILSCPQHPSSLSKETALKTRWTGPAPEDEEGVAFSTPEPAEGRPGVCWPLPGHLALGR